LTSGDELAKEPPNFVICLYGSQQCHDVWPCEENQRASKLNNKLAICWGQGGVRVVYAICYTKKSPARGEKRLRRPASGKTIPKTGSGKSWQPVALAGATGQVVQIGSIRGVYVTWKRTRLFREASEGAANPKTICQSIRNLG